MLQKRLSVLASSLFIPCMVYAQNNNMQTNTDNLVDTFLKCDAQFFQELAKNKTSYEQFVELVTTDNVTYIPVENVQKNDQNSVMFKKPIHYKGLTITGYQNIFIETLFYGKYYYWGFILSDNLDKTKETFDKLNWIPYNSEAYIANAQIYDRTSKTSDWQDNPYAIDGVIPRQGTIEKSLYLEPITNNQTHIVCSIQGDITKEILYTNRPDMKPINEKIEATRQEKIKAFKLKKQKELEQQNQQSQPNTDNKVNESDKKNGEKI